MSTDERRLVIAHAGVLLASILPEMTSRVGPCECGVATCVIHGRVATASRRGTVHHLTVLFPCTCTLIAHRWPANAFMVNVLSTGEVTVEDRNLTDFVVPNCVSRHDSGTFPVSGIVCDKCFPSPRRSSQRLYLTSLQPASTPTASSAPHSRGPSR